MAKKKQKGTNGYVAELNKLVRAEYGGEIPAKLIILIRKTAKDMLVLDNIMDQLMEMDEYTTMEVGSQGQSKLVITPLLHYHDKMSARVTDDLYNLGLTARKQAVKVEDPGDKKDNPMNEFLQGTQGI